MSHPILPTHIESTLGPVTLLPRSDDARKVVPVETVSEQRPLLSVLHIVNGEHFSGAERVQSHLGRCLPELNVHADFACVKPGKFASAVENAHGQWGKCFRTEMKGRFDFSVARSVQRVVKEVGHQLLHAHTPRTAMVAAAVAKMTGLPWVHHVHSPASRDSNRFLINRVNAMIERYSLRSADHLITVSNSLFDDCKSSGISPDKITVVHNGVPGIRPDRGRIPIVGGHWTIGMVALMRPRKGLEVALEAIAKLRQSNDDVSLRCIGPFETEAYRSEILERVQKLGIEDRIEWVGFTDDVPAALVELDAMVLPSLFGEGLPMVVLEAMAAAVPVIATRVEGTPEAITDGVEGLLATPKNPESLARKIRELVRGQHDWSSMGEAGYQRHAKDFSDRAMASGVADVYRQILK
ncbi:MAG: glycosyltransferase family 4 protein [Planctomycetota bacterium]